MDDTLFLQLLNHPENLQEHSYEELEQLILDHPYCLNLRLLLLRKYKEDNHRAYERYLQLTLLYAPDLQRLHSFLEKGSTPDEKNEEQAYTN